MKITLLILFSSVQAYSTSVSLGGCIDSVAAGRTADFENNILMKKDDASWAKLASILISIISSHVLTFQNYLQIPLSSFGK